MCSIKTFEWAFGVTMTLQNLTSLYIKTDYCEKYTKCENIFMVNKATIYRNETKLIIVITWFQLSLANYIDLPQKSKLHWLKS